MEHVSELALSSHTAVSPLVLCDRLLTLAQDADNAGFVATAERLLHLASQVLVPPQHLS